MKHVIPEVQLLLPFSDFPNWHPVCSGQQRKCFLSEVHRNETIISQLCFSWNWKGLKLMLLVHHLLSPNSDVTNKNNNQNKNKHLKKRQSMMQNFGFSPFTHPDPLPPTMATFFPAGTSKDTPARTFCPSRYSKCTLSKTMAAVCGVICRGGASSLSY